MAINLKIFLIFNYIFFSIFKILKCPMAIGIIFLRLSIAANILYGRCIHGHCCTHGHHPRGVGSIGLFLNLSKLGFVHGAYGDKGMYSFELIRCNYNLSNRGIVSHLL